MTFGRPKSAAKKIAEVRRLYKKGLTSGRSPDAWASAVPPSAVSYRTSDTLRPQMAHFVPNRCHTPICGGAPTPSSPVPTVELPSEGQRGEASPVAPSLDVSIPLRAAEGEHGTERSEVVTLWMSTDAATEREFALCFGTEEP